MGAARASSWPGLAGWERTVGSIDPRRGAPCAGPSRLFVGLTLTLAGCSGSPERTGLSTPIADDAITVGSFDFAESVLLAEVYSQALEAAGFRVERAFGSAREFVGPALRTGLIELVPEYAGTAPASSAPALRIDARCGRHARCARAGAADGSPRWLPLRRRTPTRSSSPSEPPAVSICPAQRPRAVADELTFGGPPECPARPLCLVGLQDRYGLVRRVVTLDAGGA